MSKHVVIIHEYKGKQEASWILWLKQVADRKGYEVDAPTMPHAEYQGLTI